VDQFAGTHAREVVLRDLAAEVRRSADALRQEALPHDRGELDRRLEAEAGPARRGVRVRALYPHTLLGEPAHARFLHDLSEAGVIVRVTDHVPHDMLIFDRHTVCLPGQGAADPSHRQPPAMIRIRGSVLVRSLTSIYESYWQRATPLPLARTRLHEQPLDEQERAVIRLMTSGYGDARIARKLGIEQRAVEDVMAALMERLGAGSRFEVGYKLARALGPWDLWPGNG
jgi:DNA-binding CsgD family transcriptional regulator